MSNLPDGPKLPTPYERCQEKLANFSKIARKQLKECNEESLNALEQKDYIIKWMERENSRLVEKLNALENENKNLQRMLGELSGENEEEDHLQF